MHYDTKGAAAYLHRVHGIKRAPTTLAKYRTEGKGPKYHRPAPTIVFYSADALDDWAADLLGPAYLNTTQERAAGTDLPDGAQARAAKGGA